MKSNYNQALFDKAKQKYDDEIKAFIAMQHRVEDVYDHEATNRIVYRVKQGDVQAKEELVRLHKDFIKAYVNAFKKVSKRSDPELIQAANMGFVEAVLDFDEGSGFTFLAFSVRYIKRRITEALLGVYPRSVI